MEAEVEAAAVEVVAVEAEVEDDHFSSLQAQEGIDLETEPLFGIGSLVPSKMLQTSPIHPIILITIILPLAINGKPLNQVQLHG